MKYEHGTMYPATNVTDDALIPTAKIALAHLNEPRENITSTNNTQYDYYDGLEVLENAPVGYWRGTENYWRNKRIGLYILYILVIIGAVMVIRSVAITTAIPWVGVVLLAGYLITIYK